MQSMQFFHYNNRFGGNVFFYWKSIFVHKHFCLSSEFYQLIKPFSLFLMHIYQTLFTVLVIFLTQVYNGRFKFYALIRTRSSTELNNVKQCTKMSLACVIDRLSTIAVWILCICLVQMLMMPQQYCTLAPLSSLSWWYSWFYQSVVSVILDEYSKYGSSFMDLLLLYLNYV